MVGALSSALTPIPLLEAGDGLIPPLLIDEVGHLHRDPVDVDLGLHGADLTELAAKLAVGPLERIRGPQCLPVVGVEVVEGESGVEVVFDDGGELGRALPVLLDELGRASLSARARFRP